MNFLSLFVLIPLLMLLGLWLVKGQKGVRAVMVVGSSTLLAMAIALTVKFLMDRAAGMDAEMLYQASFVWFEPLHISYAVGVDGISVSMLLLSGVIVFTGTFVSWDMCKEYFLWFTLLSMGVFGFFISVDMFMMFMFYEIALIPMYLLIGVWGSGHKEYSAMKLTLMLMGASAFLMLGIFGIFYSAGGQTMNVLDIANHTGGANLIEFSKQCLWFPFTFVGFGVLGAMFPFHTWSPDGVQTDLKYLNAYSSVSHCGMVLFAILMLTTTASTGAILQMLSHGLMTALFFAIIGMIYHRAHTRDIRQLDGLMRVVPFLAVGFAIAGLANLGLPGLSGFVAEMTIFVGSFENADMFHRVLTVVATSSIVVAAVYILRMIGKILYGKCTDPIQLQMHDAHWEERLAVIVLIACIAGIGLAPAWLSNLIQDSVQPVMDSVHNVAHNISQCNPFQ